MERGGTEGGMQGGREGMRGNRGRREDIEGEGWREGEGTEESGMKRWSKRARGKTEKIYS